jgi:EpsI family protein
VIPSVDGYHVRDIRLSDDERRVAGMSSYSARAFWRDSVIAFTTFVSYYERQARGKTIHSPKNCLPGAGWEILSSDQAEIDGADGVKHAVNHTVLKNGPSTAVVLYWYQGRGRLVANEYAVKWNLLRDAATIGHTEESLVRVVVPVAPVKDAGEMSKRIAEATDLGRAVATRMSKDLDRVLPRA